MELMLSRVRVAGMCSEREKQFISKRWSLALVTVVTAAVLLFDLWFNPIQVVRAHPTEEHYDRLADMTVKDAIENGVPSTPEPYMLDEPEPTGFILDGEGGGATYGRIFDRETDEANRRAVRVAAEKEFLWDSPDVLNAQIKANNAKIAEIAELADKTQNLQAGLDALIDKMEARVPDGVILDSEAVEIQRRVTAEPKPLSAEEAAAANAKKAEEIELAKKLASGEIKSAPPLVRSQIETDVVGLAELKSKGATAATLLEQYFSSYPEGPERERARQLNREQTKDHPYTVIATELGARATFYLQAIRAAKAKQDPSALKLANAGLAELNAQMARVERELKEANREEDLLTPALPATLETVYDPKRGPIVRPKVEPGAVPSRRRQREADQYNALLKEGRTKQARDPTVAAAEAKTSGNHASASDTRHQQIEAQLRQKLNMR